MVVKEVVGKKAIPSGIQIWQNCLSLPIHFIAIQYCSNICPNWLNCSFGSSLYNYMVSNINIKLFFVEN